MLEFLWMIPFLPLAGFLVLALFGSKLSRTTVTWIGAGSVGLSFCLAFLSAIEFISRPAEVQVFVQHIWTWFSVGNFSPEVSLYLDSLSLVFVLIITFVGFLIHIYSVEFMLHEEGYSRFFAYMNLFVGSMLILVLSADLLLLYLGWEGVGLCSYLLIGFWYKDPENGYAARKAFIVTRVGDTAIALALFLLVKNFMTLNIQDIMLAAPAKWQAGSMAVTAAAALLLGGALGKSAQLPLQTWLPDAMAGPTPVSALIHAATMVTAGVYLIARTHALFEMSPVVMQAVAIIGAVTLLVAGLSALVQNNIKKVLAYSTISQIGYMFLALGTGAWAAGIFHFVTHAFFKALLFLGAGAVILALHHEHDMTKMGGLFRKLPVTFWTFLIGAASLSALPFITAGFFSKDMILLYAYAAEKGNIWLWEAGVAGAFITSLYAFRMLFITFFGKAKTDVHEKPGWKINIPLLALAFFAVTAGYLEIPESIKQVRLFSGLLGTSLPPLPAVAVSHDLETKLQWTASIASILGIAAAFILYRVLPGFTEKIAKTAVARYCAGFLFSGWGFDRLYDIIFVRPFMFLSRINKNDFVDKANRGIGRIFLILNRELSLTQSGILRWYAVSIALGAVIIIFIAVMI